jgi:NADPH2:quinone reductase
MRAMVINRVGGPEVFESAEVATPRPGPGELLIQLAYAGVNPADWKDREGHLARFAPYHFPYVIGMDGAGIVAQVGAGVSGYRIGDRVVTWSDHGQGKPGTYAEYVVVSVAKVAQVPASIELAQAAGIPVAAITAWQAVRRADIETGRRVLVHGGSGGVGSYAIQFAKQLGASVAVTCSAAKMDYVRSLGADCVIDYRAQDIALALRDWSADGVDAIVDAVGCDTLPAPFDLLRPGGVLVSIATLVGDGDIEGDTRRGAERGMRKIFAVMDDTSADRDLKAILALIAQGAVRTPPLRVFPLVEVGAAQAALEEGKVHGKIVLHIADL